MPTQYTSPYNLPYPQATDPVRDGQTAIQGIAERVNQVLLDGSFPPGNPDINSILTRLNAIDALNAKAPLGLVKLDSRTTTGSGSSMWICQSTNAFTFKANRRYLIEWAAGASHGTAGTQGLAQLYSAPSSDTWNSTSNLTELMGFNIDFRTAGNAYRVNPKRQISYTSDTTVQIKAALSAGTSLVAGSTYPAQLSITDLGAQF